MHKDAQNGLAALKAEKVLSTVISQSTVWNKVAQSKNSQGYERDLCNDTA